MIRFPIAEGVPPSRKLYVVIELSTFRLCFIVEAGTMAEAHRRMAWLAPYVGMAPGDDVELVEMQECPGGVPTFFDGFFKGEEVDAADISVGPSTTTRQ